MLSANDLDGILLSAHVENTAGIGRLVHLQNYDLTAKPVKSKRKSTFQHKFQFRHVT